MDFRYNCAISRGADMLKRLMQWAFPIGKKAEKSEENVQIVPDKEKQPQKQLSSFFSTDIPRPAALDPAKMLKWAMSQVFQKTSKDFRLVGGDVAAMDAVSSSVNPYLLQGSIPTALMGWYASQSFIGYQTCAMISQHWLVDKACTMPAKDAVRKGYEITINDGTDVGPEIIDYISKRDQQMGLVNHCIEFLRFQRIYGIRIAMFDIETSDPNYYEKPFNIDGIRPKSYKGIVQIDPYWIVPELDMDAATDPASRYFYEPTYWQVSGGGHGTRRVHRSHLVITRTGELPDILKPTYLYGGVSVPQKIYERVYAAERTANEGPQLAMTKRLTTIFMDLQAAVGNQKKLEESLQNFSFYRDNYGIRLQGTDDKLQVDDTALGDLDATIMTQYQLVAAIAGVPATKLMGTQPKGFNSSGDYEAESYRQELESMQEHCLSPLVNRHHQLLIKSEIAPKFGVSFDTTCRWSELDSPTELEMADVLLKKSTADSNWVNAGAINGQDIRARLIADKDSGYDGMAMEDFEPELPETDQDEKPEGVKPEDKDINANPNEKESSMGKKV